MVISRGALADVVTRLNAAMSVDSSIREYVGVPVTYSFGLGRCRAVAAAGGRLYIPERGFDVIEIRRMLEAGEINAISAVPTLLRILLADPAVLGGFGDRVRWIEIGSQYMSRAEKQQMKEIFPNARILQHYGLTEASRSTFLLLNDAEGEDLESVGRPAGRVEIRISDENRIQIKGPHVALGRLADGAIVSIADESGWLTTGDVGHMSDGLLFFEGRADDVINCGGIKVDPGLLEQEVKREVGSNGRFAIARIRDPSRGDGFFIAVEEGSPIPPSTIREAVHRALKKRDINAGSSVKAQTVPSIPTTATGKIKRRELARFYQPESPLQKTAATEGGVLGLYQEMFETRDIGLDQSFQDLGGDSLNYVQMSIALERELGVLPKDWDRTPIAELQKVAGRARKGLAGLETNILLRAIAITFVVATHSGAHYLGGGTLLLLFLVGYNMARFKSPFFLSGDIWGPLVSYTKVLLVPYFVLAAFFMAYNRELQLDMLLLYTNLVRLNLSLVFPFWFVQVLVQCLLITGALFSFESIRSLGRRKPWAFAFSTALLFVAIRAVVPHVWNTDHLNNLVPHRFLAILWLGWCCYFADTPMRRLLALFLGVGFALLDTRLNPQTAWIAVGTVALLYVPQVRVPTRARHAIQIVASATFHIFIFNGLLTYAFGEVLRVGPAPVVFIIGFFGSLGASWILDELGRRVREWRFGKLRAASAPES